MKKYQQGPEQGKSKVLAGAAGHWGRWEHRHGAKIQRVKRAGRGQIPDSLERQAGKCGFPLGATNRLHSQVLGRGVV